MEHQERLDGGSVDRSVAFRYHQQAIVTGRALALPHGKGGELPTQVNFPDNSITLGLPCHSVKSMLPATSHSSSASTETAPDSRRTAAAADTESEEDRSRRLANEPVLVYTSLSDPRLVTTSISRPITRALVTAAFQTALVVIAVTGGTFVPFYASSYVSTPTSTQYVGYLLMVASHALLLLGVYYHRVELLTIHTVILTAIGIVVLATGLMSLLDVGVVLLCLPLRYFVEDIRSKISPHCFMLDSPRSLVLLPIRVGMGRISNLSKMATDDKYDRQIRLWGGHGQKALMESKILALGSTSVISETLKNLVLPGVGNFTVVDDLPVSERDLGQNFFVRREDLGIPRAVAVCNLLLELNPDVYGHAIVENIRTYVSQRILSLPPGAVPPFNLVLVSMHRCGSRVAEAVNEWCKATGTKMLLVDSIGFVGSVRTYSASHCIVESKKDTEGDFGVDLRISQPFPELEAFTSQVMGSRGEKLDALGGAEHAHVPYVLLLIAALTKWRLQDSRSPESLPSTAEDRRAIKDILIGWRRSPQEENFAEALKFVWKIKPYAIPTEVEHILVESHERFNDSCSNFWSMARALAEFSKRHASHLPLSGVVGDMTSDTTTFVRMQEVYEARAKRDREEVSNILSQLGKTVPEQYIDLVCKNALNMCLIEYTTVGEEWMRAVHMGGVELSGTSQVFRQEHNDCYPGPDDVNELSSIANGLIPQLSDKGTVLGESLAQELCRYEGCELHTISAVIGGVAAQEGVKLLTHQFVPLNNTFVFNGIVGRADQLTM
ncbi:NEDD8-activating enzyme E1 regulatory subunit [Perkinsus olseni]|uniref:NEDD8-activating enzyme E1 regulatory subunit n=1 Tax=Perkinsus olseni TaxID=32597 RepID=A0A7J6MRL9_PEROL|nr:NEDD8-activating enzyme E1 regulatory subunit [Perkinsus olseni]KAF4674215.1 NEDD8-activating enzyme E1 regulatory subunit [Perkinsus olseni]